MLSLEEKRNKTLEESYEAISGLILPNEEGVIWYEEKPDECNKAAQKLSQALKDYRNAEIKAWQEVDSKLSITAQTAEVRKKILPAKRDYEVAQIEDRDANHNYNKFIQGINAEKVNIKAKEAHI